jgi:hypothetical protein
VVGDPVSDVSAAAVVASPFPVDPGEVLPDVVEEVVVLGVVGVVDGLAPGVALADVPGLVPAAGVDPGLLDVPGLAGVVPTGLGPGAGGLLEELEGLGFGDGLGVLVAAGGGLLGAPPDPNANPMTVPGAGL